MISHFALREHGASLVGFLFFVVSLPLLIQKKDAQSGKMTDSALFCRRSRADSCGVCRANAPGLPRMVAAQQGHGQGGGVCSRTFLSRSDGEDDGCCAGDVARGAAVVVAVAISGSSGWCVFVVWMHRAPLPSESGCFVLLPIHAFFLSPFPRGYLGGRLARATGGACCAVCRRRVVQVVLH